MKKFFKIVFITIAVIVAGWIVLTIIVERTGPKRSWTFGDQHAAIKAVVVYDPDPFFNLDEQVCRSFAQILGENGIQTQVLSVAAASEIQFGSYDMYVLCANTYNWGPDLALSNFIKEQTSLDNKPVVAITLGAGSTTLSQQRLEQLIIDKGGKIIGSQSVWLLRPNDDARTKESNVQVAISNIRAWAGSLAGDLRNIK